MLTFSIRGEPDNFLKVTIINVSGFPDTTSPFGGYDTESTVEIKSSNFSIKVSLWVTTGNIYDFYQELKKCQDKLSGQASFRSYENNLIFNVNYDSLGHAYISGEYSEYNDVNNTLKFGFHTDQTFIKESVDELWKIYFKYGDNFGLKKNN